MQFNAKNLVVAAAVLATQVDAGLISELWQRQATCKNCPLSKGGIVKQIWEMVTNVQETSNCRWEATFGLPKDLGGPEKPSYDHLSEYTHTSPRPPPPQNPQTTNLFFHHE